MLRNDLKDPRSLKYCSCSHLKKSSVDVFALIFCWAKRCSSPILGPDATMKKICRSPGLEGYGRSSVLYST